MSMIRVSVTFVPNCRLYLFQVVDSPSEVMGLLQGDPPLSMALCLGILVCGQVNGMLKILSIKTNKTRCQ